MSLKAKIKPTLSLIVISLSLLGGCGGKDSSPDNADEKDTPSRPTPQEDCPIVFDIETLKIAGIQLPAEKSGYVINSVPSIHECHSSTSRNGVESSNVSLKGYSTLVAYKALTPLSSFSVSTNDVQGKHVDIQVDNRFFATPEVEAEDKKKLAEELSGIMSNYQETSIQFSASVTAEQLRFLVVLGNGRVLNAQLFKNNISLLRIYADNGDDAKNIVSSLNTGLTDLTIYSKLEANFSSPLYASTKIFLNGVSNSDAKFSAQLKLSSVAPLMLAQWNEAVSQSDKMPLLNSFSIRLNTYPTQWTLDELLPIYSEADSEWTRYSKNPSLHEWDWAAAVLRFLNHANPKHSTNDIYQTYKGMTDAGLKPNHETFFQSIWLARESGLNEAQKKVLLDLVKFLELNKIPVTDLWAEAKSSAQKLNYDSALIFSFWRRILKVSEWMEKYDGPHFSKEQALQQARELVEINNFSDEQILHLKNVFAWVKSYAGPYVTDGELALTHTKKIILAPNFSDAQFSFLKEVFTWMQSYAGPYVTDKNVALEKTTKYFSEFSITREKFSALKKELDWLKSYAGAYITDGVAALLKAETYILQDNFSADQLALLKVSFTWMTSYAGPYITDKTLALNKVENYLRNKKMDSALFNKLKLRFVERSKGGVEKLVALELAETDTF